MSDVIDEVQAAADSVGLLTQAQIDALFPERRARERTEKWTPFERFVRLQFLRLRNRR